MNEELVRIKHTGKLKGAIELVTLGFFLEDKKYSSKIFKTSELQGNPEIQDYKSRGIVSFVPESKYQEELQAEEKALAAEASDEDGEDTDSQPGRTSSPTVEDALDEDNPRAKQARQYIDAAQTALQRLEKVMFGESQKPGKPGKPEKLQKQPKGASVPSQSVSVQDVPGKPAKVEAAKDEGDDGIGLPQSPPTGLQPQSTTVRYLKKDDKERRKFLRSCRDITMLRDIALFESNDKLKKLARKRVKEATQQAEAVSV